MVKTRDQILGFGSCGCVYLIALSLFLSYPQADLFYQSKWPGHLIPQHQPPPSHHPSGTGTPSVALPMSPQNPPAPVQLQQVPGNPTQSHTILTMHHLPHLSVPHQSPSATSPHPTPSTAKRPTSFVPREKITIKNPSGQEINLDALKRAPPPVLPPSPESSKKDVERPIRIESQEQKERRLTAEERSSDSFVKANEDAARRQMEVWEHRKAEKRKSKEEAARAEKGRKETEEQATREERERKEAEEAEAAEQRRKAEEEALKTAEAAEATRALADTDAKPDSLPEEGEIMDEVSQPTTTEEILPSKRASVSPSPAPIPTDLSAKSSEKEPLRICTSIPSLPSPEHQRIRPRPLNLQTAITSNTSPPLPSTLATAWYIEDIKRITYPEGIKSPNVELNVNAQRGKFRYDRDFLLQFMDICMEKPDNLPPPDAIGLESRASRSVSVSGGQLGGRPPTMVRTISQGGTGRRDRIRSKRGAYGSNGTSAVSNPGATSLVSNMGPPMETVTPLEVSANCRVAGSTPRGSSGQVVDDIVKALLNQLTMERFGSISAQIIVWANKSEKEKDCRTLIQVVKLVFEKATDEATFSKICARLCRKMMEQISSKVQDDSIKNSEGKPFAGGNLFRKYLLNLCQEHVERGWVAEEVTAAGATSQATVDKAVKEANEKTRGGEESELYSDEYHAAVKARRRGLGLIRFIGELFKVQMLTERIMHQYIKKLLANVENPKEDEIENLCMLLTTVGGLLDKPKTRAHFDVYFSCMRALTKNKNVDERMVFILQDVIELRERKWIPRDTLAAPTTIAQVHEAAVKAEVAQEKVAVDIGVSSAPERAPQKRKLQLLPRTRPVRKEPKVSASVSESSSDVKATTEGGTPAPAVALEQIKSKIVEDVKEFFSTRMINLAESYFSGLPAEHRHRLVDALVMASIEMKEPDVKLVGDLFVRVREKDLCSPAAFEEGFTELADLLDDLAAMVIPKAWSYFAILLKGSGLDQDKERYARIAEKTTDPDRLNQLL